MLRKMFQGGSSKKQGPRIAMRDADDEPPRELKCGLVNGHQKILWFKHALRRNLARMCIMRT